MGAVNSVYDEALAYEIAFSYRDIPAEIDALARMAGRPPTSVLELAAGPARHAIEGARRGWKAVALDLSPAMCALARANADAAGVGLDVVRADMRNFNSPATKAHVGKFDLAICMISSISQLLTLDDLVAHLASVRRSLDADGCYLIEGSHPTDYLGTSSVQTEWDSERDGVTVHFRWGAESDRIDPVTQVTEVHVTITVTDAAGASVTTEHLERDRFWTGDELRAAARLADMAVTAQYGAFDGRAPGAEGAWRMISVVRPA